MLTVTQYTLVFYLGSDGKFKCYYMLCNGLLCVCYMLLVCSMLCNGLLCVTWEYDWNLGEASFLPIFLMYCFILFCSLPLASALCLHIHTFGYFRLSKLLLPLLSNPCMVGTQ